MSFLIFCSASTLVKLFFVELGFMPSALASGNKTIFWWKGNVTPPKDYKKWDDLIKALVQHWTQRYGEKGSGQLVFRDLERAQS